MKADELKERVEALPPLPDPDSPHSWLARRKNIREMVMKEDVSKFVTWPTIQGTMFVGDGTVVRKELEALQEHSLWESRWKRAIYDGGEYGAPKSKLLPDTTGNMIHQAYHIMRFETETGCSINDLKSVFELGGGYGSMRRAFNNLGYTGEYISYDLPEFSLLQQFYLSGVKVAPTSFLSGPPPETLNYAITPDLFIALWSYSEIHPTARFFFLDHIKPLYYLIAYCNQWDGYDNEDWFRGFARHEQGMIWYEREIAHLGPHTYLMGSPRENREEWRNIHFETRLASMIMHGTD